MNRSTHAARPVKNAHFSNRSTGTYAPENAVCGRHAGRKRTLVHSKWVNLISYILECFVEISDTQDFLCLVLINIYMYSKFQSHSYWQSLDSCLNLYNSPYANVRFLSESTTYSSYTIVGGLFCILGYRL